MPQCCRGRILNVGIGASAGGLVLYLNCFFYPIQTLEWLLLLSAASDPTHEGILPELIQRKTKRRLLAAKNWLKVKP
jgi:two-component system CheB/CheR fusion protein